jgi:hypothetical protein
VGDLGEGQRGYTLRRVVNSVYVRKGRGPIVHRALVRWAGEDDFERPGRGTPDYRTAPIEWPQNPVIASVPSSACDDPMEALGPARWCAPSRAASWRTRSTSSNRVRPQGFPLARQAESYPDTVDRRATRSNPTASIPSLPLRMRVRTTA